MTWFSLVDGVPPGPRNSDLDEIASVPGPVDFLKRLFTDLCGTSALPTHITEERVVPRDERVATGFCGTSEVGYRWVETECLETSTIPYRVFVETHGLPGVEVRWHYCLDHAGQAGHAAFRHESLKARFVDTAAERRFGEVWQRVFNTVPRWEAAPER